MSYAQTQETIATITHGRAALADNAPLREAWAALLEAIAGTPLPARVAFHRYVRLVHGTTAGLTIPQVISDDDVDRIRQGIAGLRAGAPLILDDLPEHFDDVDAADLSLRLELASDRPERG